jgi:hypothetical protein
MESNAAGAIAVKFEAAPVASTRHTVKWWTQATVGDPPPQVNGNGKQVESSGGTPNVNTGATSLGATTNLTTIGQQNTWEYDGTQWVIVA